MAKIPPASPTDPLAATAGAPAAAAAAAPAGPPAPLRRVPGYALEALIGRGGMAEVFRARCLRPPREGQLAAVKMLLPAAAQDPEQVRLFGREAMVTSRLRHLHIVEIYDAGQAEDGPFLAMEYVDGRNLRRILSRCAARGIRLPLDFAAYLAHVLAQALHHAHRSRDLRGQPLGIVHCDLSPQNVFISRLGEVKLGDFGVARAVGEGRGQAVFGKVRYLAPEQLRGGAVSPATDVFALGALLFELLTNEPAFPGDDPRAVAEAILSGRRRAPSSLRPEVPFALDELVLRCLGPADRLESAGAMASLLEGRYDPNVGTELAIAAVVRGLFGAEEP